MQVCVFHINFNFSFCDSMQKHSRCCRSNVCLFVSLSLWLFIDPYLFPIIISFSCILFFIHFLTFCFSQGGVATQLRCTGIFNNCVIANFPQIFFLIDPSIFAEDMDKSLVARGSRCIYSLYLTGCLSGMALLCDGLNGIICASNAQYSTF